MKIRRLEQKDLKYANKLRNEYLDFLRQEIPHNLEQQIKWFESTNDIYWIIEDFEVETFQHDGDSMPLYEIKNTVRKGIIGLTSINLKDRKAELSLITENYLDDKIANFGLGIIEKYAFEKLSLHKLYITVYQFDEKKNEYFDNRYKKEFIIRDDVFYKGKFFEHYYYSLLEDEWKNNEKIQEEKEYWNNFIDDC